MGRRVVQILILVSLLSGALAQAVICATLMQENHACCQTVTTTARLAPEKQHSSASLPPCCQTSAPVTPQQLPVEKREFQPDKNEIAAAVQPSVTIPFYRLRQASTRLRAPAGYSPPSFILHHALLI